MLDALLRFPLGNQAQKRLAFEVELERVDVALRQWPLASGLLLVLMLLLSAAMLAPP